MKNWLKKYILSLRKDLVSKLLSSAELARTRIARKKLQDFYKQTKPELAEVRHNAEAHRDHDFLKQREVLEGICCSETIQRLHDFEVVTLELGISMDALMKAGLRRLDKVFNRK